MINTDDILNDFDSHQKAIAMAESTMDWERFCVKRFLEYLQSENIQSIAEVDTKLLIRYQIYLSTLKNKKGKPYNPSTQNHEISAVRKLYKLLRRKGEVFYNPADGLEGAKTGKSLPKNILSVEEMKNILDEPDTKTPRGIRDKAIMELLYSTAIRRNEVVNLNLDDLNPDDGTILIKNGKGNKDRVVPCGKNAWKWLDKYLRECRPHYADKNEPAVFISRKYGGIEKQGIYMMVKQYALQAGIKKTISPHSFRASCATHLAENGCDIRFIQELLGHSSPSTTAIYIQVAIKKLKEIHTKFHPRERLEKLEKTA